MKRNVFVLCAIVFIFGLGFFIGQQQSIMNTFAQGSEIISVTPTSSPVPTATVTQIVSQATTQTRVIPTAGNGPRNDIVETQGISADITVAQVGDDIQFTVTIKNQAPYKKLIKQLCFNSTDGNFGCTMDFNLYPDQSFTFNNSGRFTSGGYKTIWITWTQDGQNFYRPLNSSTSRVFIQN